jgi:hypothetical protein
MATSQGRATTTRSAELAAALLSVSQKLQMASKNYSAGPSANRRAAVRISLIAAIELMSDLFPNEPSFPLPLNQLLHALADLDRGKVAPLLERTKVSNSPGNSLSSELFRAFPAAAMTRLISSKLMSRNEAAREIAKRLSRMGYKHSAGKPITAARVAKWRDKMTTELATENLAVARYEVALKWVIGMETPAAVEFLLDSLTDLFPPDFPKNPRA